MTPLFKKLNFKDQQEILVVNAPTSFDTELADIAKFTKIKKSFKNVKAIDFAIIFVLTQEQIDNAIDFIFQKLNGDAVLWFCYPKGTSKSINVISTETQVGKHLETTILKVFDKLLLTKIGVLYALGK